MLINCYLLLIASWWPCTIRRSYDIITRSVKITEKHYWLWKQLNLTMFVLNSYLHKVPNIDWYVEARSMKIIWMLLITWSWFWFNFWSKRKMYSYLGIFRWCMPDSASYITHSLMKDGVPSENSKVGINFVIGSKVKSKSWFIPTQMNDNISHCISFIHVIYYWPYNTLNVWYQTFIKRKFGFHFFWLVLKNEWFLLSDQSVYSSHGLQLL